MSFGLHGRSTASRDNVTTIPVVSASTETTFARFGKSGVPALSVKFSSDNAVGGAALTILAISGRSSESVRARESCLRNDMDLASL
jgi:hypothetical protein